MADQTRMLAAVVEPESVVCATSLDPPHGVPMWMSLQDPGKPSKVSWKDISLAICYLQVLLPREGASHIYVLITYHSPTQPIGNPYPPSKNLVL